MKRQISGVESHDTLVVGKRYHAFLHRIIEKVRHDALNISCENEHVLTVKTANHSAGSQGLDSTLLFSDIARPIAPTSTSVR